MAQIELDSFCAFYIEFLIASIGKALCRLFFFFFFPLSKSITCNSSCFEPRGFVLDRHIRWHLRLTIIIVSDASKADEYLRYSVLLTTIFFFLSTILSFIRRSTRISMGDISSYFPCISNFIYSMKLSLI